MERRMARALEPPDELAVAAQDAPHALGHGAAIAAADEAAGAEEGVGDEIGRPLGTADDLVEKFYGGGHPRARRHVDPLSAPAATMNKPAAQRPSSVVSLSMREFLKRSLLVAASILVGLTAREIGTRASTWGYLFAWPNFVLDARTVLARAGQRPLRP